MNYVWIMNMTALLAMSAPDVPKIHPIKAVKHSVKTVCSLHKAVKHQNKIYGAMLKTDLAVLIAIPILYVDGVKNELKHRF